MLLYYRGRTAAGRSSGGSIVAHDRSSALRILQGRGLVVTALHAAHSVRGVGTSIAQCIRADPAARMVAFRSLAALVQAGVSLRRALETVADRPGRRAIDETLLAVAAQVEAGIALSRAMEDHPSDFSAVAIAIVKAGETGGSLDVALETIARCEERDRALRRKVVAALTYPAIITTAAIALLVFLIGQTIPSFATTFAQMHVRLPLVTRLLLRVAGIVDLSFFWPLAVVSLTALGAAAYGLYAGNRTSVASDRARLHLPIVGSILSKATAARLARTLGSLLQAGVDVMSAFELCAGVVGPVHRRFLASASAALGRGEGLALQFAGSELFEPAFIQLVRSGEESGAVDAMLFRVAQFYESDVEASLLALTTILEPFLICSLGIAVGTIVASIIIPLYSMIGNIQ